MMSNCLMLILTLVVLKPTVEFNANYFLSDTTFLSQNFTNYYDNIIFLLNGEINNGGVFLNVEIIFCKSLWKSSNRCTEQLECRVKYLNEEN